MTSTTYPFGEIDTRVLSSLIEAGLPTGVVYDVGASNGSWTWTVAKLLKGATFHLFEPQFETDAAYAATIANVKRYTPNVSLHAVALGSANQQSKLHLFDSSAAASLLDPSPVDWLKQMVKSGGQPRPTQPVAVRRLDDYVREHRLPPPDIIKMDVQGFELEILKGAEKTLPAAKLVMAECWITRSYGPKTPLLHEVIDYLDARGFVLFDVGDTFHSDRRQITAVDAYFLEKTLALELFPDSVRSSQSWRR